MRHRRDWQHDNEFIASHSANESITLTLKTFFENARDPTQGLVANMVPVVVIELLEVVQIDHQHGHSTRDPALPHQGMPMLLQRTAVGDARQRIATGVTLPTFKLALGVASLQDPPAIPGQESGFYGVCFRFVLQPDEGG